jgi:tetratricopeptide (TPR) repeat protein
VLLLGIAAYVSALQATFVFDDHHQIVQNRAIHDLSDNLRSLVRPRGLLYLSLAINHRLHGDIQWGYHAFNIACHLAAGLLLYGVVRRTLLHSTAIATTLPPSLVAALGSTLWLTHPLQTQAVTYVIQRGEVLAGLLSMASLYGLIRSHEAVALWPRRLWSLTALACWALAVLSKEPAAVFPVILLVYDRCFLAGSFRLAFRLRPWLYGPLLVSGSLAIALIIRHVASQDSVGFTLASSTSLTYAATQPAVIVHYLRLAFWPWPLVFDYFWRPALYPTQHVPHCMLLVSLLMLTGWGLYRNHPLGVAGTWFFVTLGPTSSVIPIADLCVEHRMYFALAPLMLIFAWLITRTIDLLAPPPWRPTAMLVTGIVLCATFAFVTHMRTLDYRAEARLWRTVVTHRPNNPRAHSNLATALIRNGGDPSEAIAHFKIAMRLLPGNVDPYNNLANLYMRQERYDEARSLLQMAHKMKPNHPWVKMNLGSLARRQGELVQAEALLRDSLALNPGFSPTYSELSLVLQQQERLEEARRVLEEGMERAVPSPQLWSALASVLSKQGKVADALLNARKALELAPDDDTVVLTCAAVLAMAGDHQNAIDHLSTLVDRNPDLCAARSNLAAANLVAGRYGPALVEYGRLLKLRPRDAQIVRRVAWLLATLPDEEFRNVDEALRMATWANQVTGDRVPIFLQTLAAALANAGNYQTAVDTQRRAIERLDANVSPAIFAEYTHHLESLVQRKPIRAHPSAFPAHENVRSLGPSLTGPEGCITPIPNSPRPSPMGENELTRDYPGHSDAKEHANVACNVWHGEPVSQEGDSSTNWIQTSHISPSLDKDAVLCRHRAAMSPKQRLCLHKGPSQCTPEAM